MVHGVGAGALATAVLVAGAAVPSAAAARQAAATSRSGPVSAATEGDRLARSSQRHGTVADRAAATQAIRQRLTVAGADKALGSNVSAVVLDAATGAVVYSRNPSLALMPASGHKLVTGFVALSSMPASATFRTHVRADSTRSTVWLVGGGDPALSVSRLKEMAATTRAEVVRAGRTSVVLRVDDTLFPAPTSATGWKASYVPDEVAPVRPLVAGGRDVMDTALDAAAIFAGELVRLGVKVSSTAREKVPTGATTISTAVSASAGTLVAQLINSSNNDYAEAMHRQASLAAAKGASWSAANGHALTVLKAKGVNTSGAAVHDGSGLSRSDRMSATVMTSLLLRVRQYPAVKQAFYAPTGLPTAGVSGTLRTRFTTASTSCAKGRVRAKTGSLSDAVSLSGSAYGVDGRERLFSIIENGAASSTEARHAIDRFATAATGCTPG